LGADILKLYTSYRGDRFQVPTRQTGEYKVDVTRHPKFPLAFGEWWFPTLGFNIPYDTGPFFIHELSPDL
jgi:hypothetical protein